MTDRTLDELGPVDYLIVEFPAGAQNFTGEGADELLRLHDAGIIRVMDILILAKGEDGTVMAQELGDLDDLGELGRLEAELAETLAEEDVDNLAAAMEPGSIAGVLVYENLWAAPFASAVRRAGGQLIANGRIPIQAIIAAIEADEALVAAGDLTCRSGPTRVGRAGVVGAPVAKAAVVGAAVSPGPSPVAKAAVVGAAVSPGPSPVAKAAVVGAVVTPGRRRF